MKGVSVVICCHNSAARLPATLAHLVDQVATDFPWEVIVVDNASTDATARVARTHWPADAPAPLRVVPEPEPGLSHARHRGFREARYAFVSFIDDDNWVCPTWVRTACEVMSEHPDVGVCGSYNEAACEVEPPDWFRRFKASYAVGPQGDHAAGEVTWKYAVCGAGMTVRKAAWEHLVAQGFRSLLVDRKGTALLAGGDSELCFALQLSGWRVWYDPRLKLRHFIPAHRLSWDYLCRLHRGFGAAWVWKKIYVHALTAPRPDQQITRSWPYAALKVALILSRKMLLALLTGGSLVLFEAGRRLISKNHTPRQRLRDMLEGDRYVLATINKTSELKELIRRRNAYTRSVAAVHDAPWNIK